MAGGIMWTSFIGFIVIFVVGYVCTIGSFTGAHSSPSPSSSDGKSWFDGLFPSDDIPKATRSVESEKHSPNGPVKDLGAFGATFQSLQVPCGYIVSTSEFTINPSSLAGAKVHPQESFLDPTSAHSLIAEDVVMGDRYLKLLFQEGGHPGHIPKGALYLRMGSVEATVSSPVFKVVPRLELSPGTMDLLLGRDFMKENKATMDLETMEAYVTIHGEKVMVPFLQKRVSPLSDDGEL